MTNEKYNLIFTVVESLEASARLEFGDDSKYVRYAMQIRDLLRVKPKTTDYAKLFEDEDEPVESDMQPVDLWKPPAKTSIRANDCKPVDTDCKFVHNASQMDEQLFSSAQKRVIAQRLIAQPTLSKCDGYLTLSTDEKRRIMILKSQIKHGAVKVLPESDICNEDDIAAIDLHFECTKISLKRKGFWYDVHEHTFIAQYLWNKHISHDNSGWTSLSPAERQVITCKCSALKRGKLKPIDPKLVNAERICWHFGLDWNKIKESL